MFERKRNFQAIFRDPSGRVVASRRTATMKEAVTVAQQNAGVAANVDVRNLSTGGSMIVKRSTISARPAPTTTMTRAQVQAQPHMQAVPVQTVRARSQGSGIFGAMNAAAARMGSKIRW